MLAAWLATGAPQEIAKIAIACPIFGAIGYAIDWLGAVKLKLWGYSRQLFGKTNYYTLVISGWIILSVAINAFWNWCQSTPALAQVAGYFNVGEINFLDSQVLIFAVVYAVFVGLCEIPNFKTKTWTYNAPWWLVLSGWIPLIGLIRLIYLSVPA
jgi:hypothetical protein